MQLQKKYHIDPEARGEHDASLYRFDKMATYVETLSDITDEHIEFYRTYGYLAVKQVYTPEEVEAGIAGMLHLIGGGNPDFTGVQFEHHAVGKIDTLTAEERQDYVRKLMAFVEYDARLKALSEKPELRAFLRKLIGDEPVMFQDMGLLKPPKGGTEKPWHQDKSFFNLRLDMPVVGAWIALDEAGIDNGCMHVLPGTHREGPIVHFKRRDWQICDNEVQVGRDVVVPLPPGGVLFFDGLLHHGTPLNNSPKRRRALQYHYTKRDAIWLDHQARMDVFGSEGKDVTC